MAEIHVAKLGMPVEPHRAPDEGIELPHEEVGQVEGGEFLVARAAKAALPSKKE